MDVGLPLKPYCPFFFKVGRIYPKIQSIITDLKFNYLTELLFFYATLVIFSQTGRRTMGKTFCPLKGVESMARKLRKKSMNRIYDIMLRGVKQQIIFEDREDRVRLLRTISKCKKVSKFELYAYCLMNNHVHLLIKETEESISKVVQRISTGYVLWYNNKYERSGHL